MCTRTVIIAGLLTLAVACRSSEPPRSATVRFDLHLPEGQTLGPFAVSPDGGSLVYSAETERDRTRRLFVRVLGAADSPDRELEATAGATNPFFSPDGRTVAYFSHGAIWRTGTDGRGQPRRLADIPAQTSGGTWTDDGRIVFAPLGRQGLMQVAATGGAPSALTALVAAERELAHEWPHALPGGAIAFTVSQRGRDAHLEVLSPEGERSRLRVPIAGPAQFVATGHLVYGYLGNLMAVRFDREAFRIAGIPRAVAKGLNRFSVSLNGTLVWLRSSPDDAKTHLVRVTRAGAYERLPAPAEVYQTPRFSPDGRRLAVVVRPDFMTREIRVLETARPERVVFTLTGGDNQSPAWMDNRRLTFGSNRDGPQKIYVAAGSARVQPLFTADVSVARNPAVWSKPPRLLALYEIEPARGRDVLLYRVGESIVPIAAGDANERSPALSPDGRWIAFVSDRSGRDEVYVKLLDGSMEAIQLTSSGAVEPVWTREGLFYRDGDRMMLADVRPRAPAAVRTIFEGDFDRDPGANLPAYDVDLQGNFIMLKNARQPRLLRVVRNWGTELLAQMP